MFTSTEKRRIGFTSWSSSGRQRNVLKSVMQVQNCCFANKTNCFHDIVVVVVVVVALAPYLFVPNKTKNLSPNVELLSIMKSILRVTNQNRQRTSVNSTLHSSGSVSSQAC